ncbi:MAG: hypothetical protein JWN11_2505 [Hyphomicrobiales bacterium]|nr:hypothetical protein [Hyphomicrobiales bacterium]
MSKDSGSITRRLVLTLTLGTTVLWLIAAIVSSGVLQHELRESFDRGLMETANRLLPLTVDGQQDKDGLPGKAENLAGHDARHQAMEHDHRLVYQLRRQGGDILMRSEDAPAQPFDKQLTPGFSDNGDFRIFTLVDPQSQLAIQVAEPLAIRKGGIFKSTLTLFLPLLLLIPLSIAGIWFAIRRGLKPLTALQEQIAARDSANLAPLAVDGLPRELKPIADALARLIERLRAAFDAERSFAANSAHELRTPIAGALAQTQRLIASAEDDTARAEGRKIEATLKRLADLAEKLIQLARADAGIASSSEAIAVMPVLRLVVADCAARTRPPRDIRIEIEPGAEEMTAKINIDALAIVLRNLIDNAVAHGIAEMPIDVIIAADRSIAVRNAAPVVPPEALERLRHRFERGPTAAAGSGLGLAIVETILSQTGISLELRSPVPGRADGFEAVLRFPPS